MKKLFILSIYLLLAINVLAQVPSHIYSAKEKVFRIHPQFLLSRATAYRITMPSFDVSRLIKEDEQVKGKDVPYRFGKSFDVDISLDDGIWSKADSGQVWNFSIASPGAYSLNFILDKLYLPKGAKLYIFNNNGTMVYGPVTTRQNITKGLFLTDLIKGDIAVFYLFEPFNVKGQSRLHIKRVVHAYRNLFKSFKTNTNKLASCEKDIACSPAWINEANAVALVLLSSGNALCSGSILNNTAQNYRAYFLTAFHCIDLNHDASISSVEKSEAENWAFRFRYRKTTCGGSPIENYITYNRDNFRSAWNTSDFALVELVNSPITDTSISFLGWDRSGDIPNNVACIHYPEGDIQKIAIDSTSPSNSGNYFWEVNDWSYGTVEHGSSGAPFFNSSHRVIGQVHGGNNIFCNPNEISTFGKLSFSWTGGGTDETRLSNWLDPYGTGASTINTINRDYITGHSPICTSNATFTLNDRPSGTTVSWINSSNLTYVSGQGTDNYTVQAANSSVSGMGWVKALVSSPYGNNDTIEKNVWVGKPATPTIICPYTKVGLNSLIEVNAVGPGAESYNWTVGGGTITSGQGTSDIWIMTSSSCLYDLTIRLTTSNACGNSAQTMKSIPFDCSGGITPLSVSPNPASQTITVELKDTQVTATSEIADKEFTVKLLNSYYKPVYQKRLKAKRFTINVSRYRAGIYYLQVIKGNKIYSKKVIITTY